MRGDLHLVASKRRVALVCGTGHPLTCLQEAFQQFLCGAVVTWDCCHGSGVGIHCHINPLGFRG